VEHPAAKMLILASQQQEHEVGDGTNFVIMFAGKLLEKAEYLLRMVRIADAPPHRLSSVPRCAAR
jgi:T-complex protein 1 subunit theta